MLSRPDTDFGDIHVALSGWSPWRRRNTFGGTSIVLGEFDLKDRVAEINLTAAKLAKEVAQQFSTKSASRVAGIDGTHHQAAFLGPHRIRTMAAAYEDQLQLP